MKTTAVSQQMRYMILLILVFTWTTASYSQQVLKLKDGKEYKISIVYQSKDTLRYHLSDASNVTYTILMDQVQSIRIDPYYVKPQQDTVYSFMNDKAYLHYKHNMNTGIGLAIGGGVVAGVGIILMSTVELRTSDLGFSYFTGKFSGVLLTGLGGGLCLTGVILAIVNSVNMSDYMKSHHKVSVDVKYSAGMKGISVVYRF
jgi:hypothetical protein